MAKVLVADDDVEIRSILRMLLEDVGYEIHEAADGEAALRFVREVPGVIVLLDLFMPEMNGFEFLQAVSADSNVWPQMRCVVVSAYMSGAREIAQIAATTATPIPFVPKPFDVDRLLDAVETLAATLPSTS